MSAMPNDAQRKIMVSFAFLAYCGEAITVFDNPTPQAKIKQLIDTAMPKLPPIATGTPPVADWQIAWGPAVYTVPGSVLQDHMMYAVQNIADPSQIVVAIRGTNGKAEVDWLLDDLALETMVPWPPGTATAGSAGSISESTSVDLQRLLLMTSPLDNDTTLLQYLKAAVAKVSGTPFVTVTGHSKGGAMSSTMALYLLEEQSQWDSAGTAVVTNVSFAGPTAGDKAFAAYSDAQFANPTSSPAGWDASLKSNMDACRNSLDVATLAWTASNYGTIKDLYKPNIKTGLTWSFINGSIQSGFQKLLGSQNFVQVKVSQPTMTGTLSGKFKQNGGIEKFVAAFADEGGYQHHAYPAMLGVPEAGDPSVITPT